MKKLSDAALKVLGSMETTGGLAMIKAGQLDRALYKEVNSALEAIGGQWLRKEKAHAFPRDPRDALDQIVLTGGFVDKKQEFGFFETPEALTDRVIQAADPKPGLRWLEPSAGVGRLAMAIDRWHVSRAAKDGFARWQLTMVELNSDNAARLHKLKLAETCVIFNRDFLQIEPDARVGVFDRIVMNPPFARQADVDHVEHALTLLKPGGKLVAIMSAGVMFRDNKKTKAFRELGGELEKLPDDSFKESGTNVSTCLFTYQS